MKKHFVTFLSPGTLVSETSTVEIDSWDVDDAKKKARGIVERHSAKPYGFYFTTRSRDENELDSKETGRSGTYYLGGVVKTLAEIKAVNDPNDKILISNMEMNRWDKVITNTNSWSFTAPLYDNDVVLDF